MSNSSCLPDTRKSANELVVNRVGTSSRGPVTAGMTTATRRAFASGQRATATNISPAPKAFDECRQARPAGVATVGRAPGERLTHRGGPRGHSSPHSGHTRSSPALALWPRPGAFTLAFTTSTKTRTASHVKRGLRGGFGTDFGGRTGPADATSALERSGVPGALLVDRLRLGAGSGCGRLRRWIAAVSSRMRRWSSAALA